MYLVDANVWLERLLGQTHSEEVGLFLDKTPSDQLFITDFAFHSISITLLRLKAASDSPRIRPGRLCDGAVQRARLDPEDTERILTVCAQFSLDYDDAYINTWQLRRSI